MATNSEFVASVSTDAKKRLLSNVWCSLCHRGVTTSNFIGAVKAGNLSLVGSRSECRGDVARVVEVGWQWEQPAGFSDGVSSSGDQPSLGVAAIAALV